MVCPSQCGHFSDKGGGGGSFFRDFVRTSSFMEAPNENSLALIGKKAKKNFECMAHE